MHHIKTDEVEYAFPANELDMVFKLITYLKSTNVEYEHYFID